jgi:phage virion morphogenesis protein
VAGAVIKVKMDSEVLGLVKRLDKACGSPRTAMSAIGVIVRDSSKRNFIAGGRPDKWEESQAASDEGRRTLIDHGHLRDSITYKTDSDSVTIGTNRQYAAVHQFGIDKAVTVPAHTRRARVGIESKAVQVKQHKKHMKLPARPFLAVQDEDWKRIRTVLRNYLRKVQQ